MKFCKNCSAALEDDAVFCTECGESLADDNFTNSGNLNNNDNTEGFQGSIPTPSSDSSGNSYSSNSDYSSNASNNQSQYNEQKGSNPGTPWLIVSIVCIFCCSGLFAIPGLILSIMSTTSFNAGDMEDATSKAKTAKWLTIGAIVLGVIVNILVLVLFFGVGAYTYY